MGLAANGIITLTTDFGLTDGYVGALKGSVLQVDASLSIVDVTHQVPPQNLRRAARVLATACPHFPPGTVHIAVVDPGVGGPRRPVLIETGTAFYVGPDNGIFSEVLARSVMESAVCLDRPEFHRSRVSHTFHGRDIFAPVAALVASGRAKTADVGSPVDDLVALDIEWPELSPGRVQGKIIQVDAFGNLISNISASDLPPAVLEGKLPMRVEIGNHIIEGLSRSYGESKRGTLIALIGSNWELEISVSMGSAVQSLKLEEGEDVVVRFPSIPEED